MSALRHLAQRKSWAWKSLLLNGLGSCLDFTVLFVGGELIGLPTPIATMLGVASGATFNFLMNRRFAFSATSGAIEPDSAI